MLSWFVHGCLCAWKCSHNFEGRNGHTLLWNTPQLCPLTVDEKAFIGSCWCYRRCLEARSRFLPLHCCFLASYEREWAFLPSIFSIFSFNKVLLWCNSHTIKLTHLQCAIYCVFINTDVSISLSYLRTKSSVFSPCSSLTLTLDKHFCIDRFSYSGYRIDSIKLIHYIGMQPFTTTGLFWLHVLHML